MSDPGTDYLRLQELHAGYWRQACRAELLSFCIHALSWKRQTPARHHRLICQELEAVARGEVLRLMILAPPGSAKTTYVSRLFPAWYFASHPDTNIIAASHTARLAETNSTYVQRYIRDNERILEYGLRNDAKDDWETTNDCHYLAIGVGGAVTGSRADLVIIDDPIKSRAEAESLASRDHLWDWYNSDLLTRPKPNGAIVLIATPYHQDDLMGRILEREKDQHWRVLRLPAIAEADDPLGREEGEPLWSDGAYGYDEQLVAKKEHHEVQGLLRDWHSQYQGRPRPPEGAMFLPGEMPILDYLPPLAGGQAVRAWDLGGSVTGDWTVGLKLVHRAEDRLPLIVDIRRVRQRPHGVRALVKAVADADGMGTKTYLPQDPAQAGVDQGHSYVELLAGHQVELVRMTGDKVTRADVVASQCNIGRVGMLKAPWNAAFIDELGSFPLGAWDDQVDALSLAYVKLVDGEEKWRRWRALAS